MKTSTPEVLCDLCERVIPPGKLDALFVSLKGIEIKRMKADFCGWPCLILWATHRRKE